MSSTFSSMTNEAVFAVRKGRNRLERRQISIGNGTRLTFFGRGGGRPERFVRFGRFMRRKHKPSSTNWVMVSALLGRTA